MSEYYATLPVPGGDVLKLLIVTADDAGEAHARAEKALLDDPLLVGKMYYYQWMERGGVEEVPTGRTSQ